MAADDETRCDRSSCTNSPEAACATRPQDKTLQATALVNEAYLRLVGQSGVHWCDRSNFFAFAAHIMRNVLVDYIRARTAAKRGGGLICTGY